MGELFLLLKKLSVFHHLAIYYPQLAVELIELVDLEKIILAAEQNTSSTNDWLLTNVIRPYGRFLTKYCLSMELYDRLRKIPYGSTEAIFEAMCFAVNLFRALFSTVRKLPSLGRYFREQHTKTVDYFV